MCGRYFLLVLAAVLKQGTCSAPAVCTSALEDFCVLPHLGCPVWAAAGRLLSLCCFTDPCDLSVQRTQLINLTLRLLVYQNSTNLVTCKHAG